MGVNGLILLHLTLGGRGGYLRRPATPP